MGISICAIWWRKIVDLLWPQMDRLVVLQYFEYSLVCMELVQRAVEVKYVKYVVYFLILYSMMYYGMYYWVCIVSMKK